MMQEPTQETLADFLRKGENKPLSLPSDEDALNKIELQLEHESKMAELATFKQVRQELDDLLQQASEIDTLNDPVLTLKAICRVGVVSLLASVGYHAMIPDAALPSLIPILIAVGIELLTGNRGERESRVGLKHEADKLRQKIIDDYAHSGKGS